MRTDDAFNQLRDAAAGAGPAEARHTYTQLQLACGDVRARIDGLQHLPPTSPLMRFLRAELDAYTALVATWREQVATPASPAPTRPTIVLQTARPLNRATRKGY